MQQASKRCEPESIIPLLGLAVLEVRNYQQRVIGKNLFGLCLADFMSFFALPSVAFVPLKRCNLAEVKVWYHTTAKVLAGEVKFNTTINDSFESGNVEKPALRRYTRRNTDGEPMEVHHGRTKS